MTRLQAIEKAAKRAKLFHEPYAVVTIDHEDTRRVSVMPYANTQYDEFLAFDGEIEYVIDQEGNIEV